MTRWLLFLLVLLSAVGAHAQTSPPVPRTTPPVLSTIPTPPAGAVAEPAQMSGVPLQVGDLPPGVVVVRIVRRSFQTNLPGQSVTLRVGDGPSVMMAATGDDGRAQFSGLRVGDYVQLRATVGAERLESQRFQLPAEAGTRLVLVADVGSPTASGPEWTTTAIAATSPVGIATPTGSEGGARAIVVGGLIGVALAMLGSILWPHLRSKPAPHALVMTPSVAVTPPYIAQIAMDPNARREELFERLVALEHDRTAGRVSDAVFAAMRNRLIDDIAAIDVQPLSNATGAAGAT